MNLNYGELVRLAQQMQGEPAMREVFSNEPWPPRYPWLIPTVPGPRPPGGTPLPSGPMPQGLLQRVGDVINKSGTFAAMQDQTEQLRRLNPWALVRPLSPTLGGMSNVIPLVPLDRRSDPSRNR